MHAPPMLRRYQAQGFTENPFGERTPAERMQLAQSWLSLAQWHNWLARPRSLVILYGPQGHGKSSHLLAYKHHYAPVAPFIKLHQRVRPPTVKEPFLLVDDLDHLGPLMLARWLAQPGLRQACVLAATHRPYRWLPQLLGWRVLNINLTSPPPEWWQHYLRARLAAVHPQPSPPMPPPAILAELRQRHGTHIRALEWDLYDYYQQAVAQ